MAQDMTGLKDQAPIVDEISPASESTRFLIFGVLLIVVIAAVVIAGPMLVGEPVIVAVLAIFASVGMFFLLAMLMGLAQLKSRDHSSELARAFVNELDSGLLITDQEGRIVYANRAYGDLLGAHEASRLKSIENLLSNRPEAADIIYRMANRARTGQSCTEEFRLDEPLHTIGNKGNAVWLRVEVRPLARSSDRRQLTAWTISDETSDRMDREVAFQRLQDAIHYLDHAPAGFLASDDTDRLVHINATLADWLGIDLARFEPGSMTLRSLVSNDTVALYDSLRSEPVQGKTSMLDLDLTKTNGKLLPVRLYHRIPPSSDGAPGATRTIVLNRANSAGEADAVQSAETRFLRFFNSTPLAIAGVDGTGNIVRANAPFEKMFAHVVKERETTGGLSYEALVQKEDRSSLEALFKRALNGEADILPVEMCVDDATNRFVRFFVSPIRDASMAETNTVNDTEMVIIYAMETTELKALENNVAQGQKLQAVGQLAGGIAHDFNNVLSAIIGGSELLLVNHKPTDPSFQDILDIKNNANRAAGLVRQLLAFSRRQTLRPQVLQLSDVLFDVQMMLKRLLGENVELNVKHGRDLWPIKADRSQVEQVIVNLTVNAKDAMQGDGRFDIRTRNLDAKECQREFSYPELQPADYVHIEVEDNGSGMSEEVLRQIFEPFFSTKEVGKGTGLGLASVYGIIKQTGGYIYPESTLGQGTTFNIFLPRHVPDEAEKAANEAAKQEDKQEIAVRDLTGDATILLVEDEDAVRTVNARLLAKRGYTIHEASTGVEALEIMEEVGEEIDLVVSDVVMPEMNGPELLVELRKLYPDMKFIFVSGHAEDAFATSLPKEHQGRFGFLAKPFTNKDFATTIKDMLEGEG